MKEKEYKMVEYDVRKVRKMVAGQLVNIGGCGEKLDKEKLDVENKIRKLREQI